MGKIRILPEQLINKIAAGEIIERPASVVKELIENSIDAGAMRISIELENGGKKLVRVTDDGVGMDADDLQLAFQKHSTSKIGKIEDLFNIRTKGFRGEALASVASVSHVKATSCPKGGSSGHYLEILGGEVRASQEKGTPQGTCVEVRKLFFNTPVRLKFLKSDATEVGHISDIVIHLALGHPEIYFEVVHNGRKVYSIEATDNLLNRIASFFGKDLADELIPGTFHDGYLGVTAFLGQPSQTRSNAKSQYIFVNRRFIKDRLILHSIAQGYQDYLELRRYPVVFLYLEIDPGEVDMNVHPTKIEVRFRNSAHIHNIVRKVIKDALESADLAPSLGAISKSAGRELPRREESIRPKAPRGAGAEERRQKEALFDLFKKEKEDSSLPVQVGQPVADKKGEGARGRARAFQVHDSFIVEQTETGINIIDQHALHERILYEEICKRLEKGKLASQRLLISQPVQLSPSDHAKVMEMKEVFGELGIEIEDFGGTSVVIRSLPEIFSAAAAGEILEETAAEMKEAIMPKETMKAKEKLASILSCKAAVKSGTRLSTSEIEELLEGRDRMANRFHCPHGRPTTLSFSLEEIRKGFRRK